MVTAQELTQYLQCAIEAIKAARKVHQYGGADWPREISRIVEDAERAYDDPGKCKLFDDLTEEAAESWRAYARNDDHSWIPWALFHLKSVAIAVSIGRCSGAYQSGRHMARPSMESLFHNLTMALHDRRHEIDDATALAHYDELAKIQRSLDFPEA